MAEDRVIILDLVDADGDPLRLKVGLQTAEYQWVGTTWSFGTWHDASHWFEPETVSDLVSHLVPLAQAARKQLEEEHGRTDDHP